MKRSRGFTLVEMMVYMSLVAVGLLAAGGIELQAQQALAVQASLVDIDRQSASYLGQLRRDVEDASRLEVKGGAELVVFDRDGGSVVYRAGERVVLFPGGTVRAREPYRLLKTLTIADAKQPRRLAVVARFEQDDVVRTFRRVAAPRREVTGD